jgi:hypothetical protein
MSMRLAAPAWGRNCRPGGEYAAGLALAAAASSSSPPASLSSPVSLFFSTSLEAAAEASG